MQRRDDHRDLINYLKTVSTSTKCLEFIPEEKLEELDLSTSRHIQELEDLICRLSLEAEAMVWRLGYGHELIPTKRDEQ